MNVHDFDVATADGGTRSLSDYAGKVLLVVNVASRCGMTPQYAGLEALHREFGPRGLQVLGFPCNQFGGQEPGTDEEIQEFCSLTYDVTFPVLAKVDVNGPDADPLYAFLRSQAPGDFGPEHFRYERIKASRPESIDSDEIRWNFTKFLIGRDGAVLRRYESKVTPEQIGKDLTEILG
jgi:glutathione peroxidase